ncbi:MAG: DNA polymerase III subunit chi [Desulfuromonas sp.]|nr:MAG: DNA polymerase III subunit chi [Desulfuromonas sp.]
MPTVEFIRLRKPEKAKYLCDLAEDYLEQGKRVLVTVLDENQAVTLDRFMWEWKKGSFIPHVYANGAVESLDDPVVIVTDEINPNGAKVLVMGKPCSVDFLRQFDLVIDFAELYDDTLAEASRVRFARYREVGFAPKMHE